MKFLVQEVNIYFVNTIIKDVSIVVFYHLKNSGKNTPKSEPSSLTTGNKFLQKTSICTELENIERKNVFLAIYIEVRRVYELKIQGKVLSHHKLYPYTVKF